MVDVLHFIKMLRTKVLLCSFGIEYVWLAVPAGWFANFLISYVALRKSWPADDEINIDKDY